jgi:hypothetical protein
MEIEVIRVKIGIGEYRFSDHAVKRMIKRNIERIEIEEASYQARLSKSIPTINIPRVVLFTGGRNRADTFMFSFQSRQQLLLLRHMSRMRANG